MREGGARKGKLIGYGRVSTNKQRTGLQRTAMRAVGIDTRDRSVYFEDKRSGATAKRPEFQACLDMLQPGDVLCVWTMDRAFRSFRDYVNIVEALAERGIGFRCLTQPELTTEGATGRLLKRIIAAVAQFERELLIQRIRAGLAESNKKPGRRTVITPEVVADFRLMHGAGMEMPQIAKRLGIGLRTIYDNLDKLKLDEAA